MGVDYRAILYVGKRFEDQYDAKDFYERFFSLSEGDLIYIEDESFEEYCYNLQNGLSGTVLNKYNDYGFVLGIDLSSAVRNPDTFSSKVEDAIKLWENLFGKEQFQIVHAVCVY